MNTRLVAIASVSFLVGVASGAGVGIACCMGGSSADEAKPLVAGDRQEGRMPRNRNWNQRRMNHPMPADSEFVEAVPADKVKREEPIVVVEEVKDENGLTAQERLEKFKREHPEEYQAHLERREKMMADRRAAQEKRQNFLDTVDPSLLNEEQRKVHQAYADALAVRDAYREEIRKARQNGEEVTVEMRAKMSEAERVIRQNSEAEREALLQATARALGVQEDGLSEFSSTVKTIYESTSAGGHRGGPFGGGFGGGRRH